MTGSSTQPLPDPAERLLDEFLSGSDTSAEAFGRFVAGHPQHQRRLERLFASLDAAMAAMPGGDPAGEPESSTPTPAVGMRLGDFELVRFLGEGGMGQVWEAEDLALGRRVALKLVRPGFERGGLERLSKEARAAGRVSHRGIVPVFAVGEVDGVPYVVQQLVANGRTLADVISEGADGGRDPRATAARLVEVCEAVQAAHDLGILHLDLKPRNILIGADGRPMVGDFGLAHVRGDQGSGGGPRGTCAYMSPEQATGRVEGLDARADTFALGAVLYEALTGRRAFRGGSPGEILAQVESYTPESPRSLDPRIPRDLSAVCMRALEKDPGRRYASVGDLAEDLRRMLRHEPTRARPPSVPGLLLRWMRRHPVQAVAMLAVVVVMAFLTAMLNREAGLRALADRRAHDSQVRSYHAAMRAAQVQLDRGRSVEARMRLDECVPELRSWEWYLAAKLVDSSVMLLGEHPPGRLPVAISADGRRIVTADAEGDVRVFDGATGTLTLLLAAGTGNAEVGSLALAADGRTLACGLSNGRVVLLDIESGERLAELTGHTEDVNAVAISADGLRVVSGSADGSVRSWDGRERREVTVMPHLHAGIASVALSDDGTLMATSSRYGVVSLRSGEDGSFLAELNSYERDRSVVDLDATGGRAGAGLADGRAKVWDTSDGRLLREIEAYRAPISAVSMSRDGTLLVTAPDGDGPICVWNVADGRCIATLSGHRGRVTGLSATQGAERVVAGCEDGSAYVWELAAARATTPWALSGLVPRDHAVSNDGRTVAACRGIGQDVLVWRDGERLSVQPARASVRCVALDGNGERLVGGLLDGSLAVWSLPEGRLEHRWSVGSVSVETVTVAADGTRAAAAVGDDVLLVDLADGSTRALSGHTAAVTQVVANTDLTRLATASVDGTVRVWDVERDHDEVVVRAARYADHVLAADDDLALLAISPSGGGRILLARLPAGPLRSADELPLQRLVTLPSGVPSLAFVSGGRRLVLASSASSRLTVWDVEEGDELVDLPAGTDGVSGLAAGAGRLFGLASDGLRLWDGTRPSPEQVLPQSR
ncbi:MAG: WD40 repeat domain-containing serine/threonine-protein kinase [Planctomycetota bacterium]|jgi:WD40 repeat protein